MADKIAVRSAIPAVALGVVFGAALYVLGAVTAPYVVGVSAPVYAAIGFASGFVLGLGIE